MSNDIYSYILENFGIEITDYQFKRDYIKEPLKRGEKPFKDDLEYLYITLNLTRDKLCQLFNKNIRVIKSYISFNKIKKSMKIAIINSRETYKNYCLKYPNYKINHINKIKQTKLRKYGDENYNNKEKTDQTNLEKYGVKRPLQNKDIHHKLEISNIKKYGVKTPLSLPKNRITKNISKEELKCFELLKEKYPLSINQYFSEKYPFSCDFYIPELDLYIEYQGFGGGHNNRPFNENDETHIKELMMHYKLAENGNTISQRIIRAWFLSDPLKRETAKKNNLNYLEFFNMKQFMEWYNQQK